jgi:hypothetical protein
MTEEEFEKLALDLREAGYLRRPALEEGAAYRAGWEEGLFAPIERTAPHSESIMLFDGVERLAFWQAHRHGRSMREPLFASATTPAKPRRVTTAAWPPPAVGYSV